MCQLQNKYHFTFVRLTFRHVFTTEKKTPDLFKVVGRFSSTKVTKEKPQAFHTERPGLRHRKKVLILNRGTTAISSSNTYFSQRYRPYKNLDVTSRSLAKNMFPGKPLDKVKK